MISNRFQRQAPRRWPATLAAIVLVATTVGGVAASGHASAATAGSATPATAWKDGHFAVDTSGVVGESDVVLGRPNTAASQSLPLGNGTLGVAAWAADGFTAQLNRADTMPDRLSPGQVVIPGLSKLTTAPDFTGRLDLYNGTLRESGGGMTLKSWVANGSDQLIVQVTGADPAVTQTAELHLWNPRTPTAAVSGTVGVLSQTWKDDTNPAIGSGGTFGSLAAITASGQGVTAQVTDPLTVRVSFKPNADGSFRVVIAAPHWAGGDATAAARRALGGAVSAPLAPLWAQTTSAWHRFWGGAGLMQITSPDGQGQYVENIRTMFLYANKAESPASGYLPGSEAGSANLFNYSEDSHNFYPGAYWFWNERMLAAANLSTGEAGLNIPLYNLYARNINNIRAWTQANMGGLPGLCVPETMRYNGNGYQSDTDTTLAVSCQNSTSTWNGETITSGTELSLWIWQQYQQTGDRQFLRTYAPLILGSAQFLLAYAIKGSDGLLHTISNAHETQWDVPDPTTTIAAMQALFPVAVQVARMEHADGDWIPRWTAAEGEIPPYARTDEATHTQLLTSAADASGTDVIGDSYQPTAPFHNEENIGLEPVWPYDVIGDDSGAMTALAVRTYDHRPYVNEPDWSDDAIDAARLDLSGQVQSDIVASIEGYQPYISGLGSWLGSTSSEPMIEESGVVTTALDEALATQYDGTLRIAPAWPADWNVSGTIFVQDNTKVDVQVENGTTVTAAIEADATHTITVRSPWPGQAVTAVDGVTGKTMLAPTTASTFSLSVKAGRSYLLEPVSAPTTALAYQPVTGTPATSVKTLGGKTIGIAPAARYPSLAASYDDTGITSDTDTSVGNIDGGGASMSAQAMTAAGAPSGGTLTVNGQAMPLPGYGTGSPDNTLADGQDIDLTGTGSTLGLLYVATYGPLTATGTIVYTDGTTQSYTLTSPDWQTAPSAGQTTALTLAYQNRPGNVRYSRPSYLLYAGIPLAAGKTVASVELPTVGPVPVQRTAELHVFSMAIG